MSAEYLPVGSPGLGAEDRDRLHALARERGPGAYIPALVEALADGGVAPALDSEGAPCCHEYGYVVSREDGQIVAAVPVLVTAEAMAEVVGGSEAFRRASERLRRHRRGLAARTVIVGTPLAQRGGIVAAPGIDGGAALDELEAGIEALAAARGCSMVVWKDLAADDALVARLGERGYEAFVSLPAATIDLSRVRGLDEYLRWVGTVASRGDLWRKIQRADYRSPGVEAHLGGLGVTPGRLARAREGAALRRDRWLVEHGRAPGEALRFERTSVLDEATLDRVHALYMDQRGRARFAWETLTRGCFERVAAAPGASFAVARLGSEVLGFSASVALGERFVTLRAGTAAAAVRAFSLPVLLVLHDIEAAIDRGCREIELGPTGYALKARFGARFTASTSLLRVRPPYTAFTRPIAAAIDASNRAAGLAGLHRMTFVDAWIAGSPASRT